MEGEHIMKKIRNILLTLSVLSLAVSLASCGQNSAGNTEQIDVSVTESEELKEVITEEPQTESADAAEEKDEETAEFEVTSEDLHDGVWDSVISNTKNGSNVSPQLTWEPVEGAAAYVVYMVDTSATNWMHWRSGNITETSLEQGSAVQRREYVGPYPPSGTHTYEIWVYALETPADQVPGKFNQANGLFDDYKDQINETSKILAVGHLSGTYTYGD